MSEKCVQTPENLGKKKWCRLEVFTVVSWVLYWREHSLIGHGKYGKYTHFSLTNRLWKQVNWGKSSERQRGLCFYTRILVVKSSNCPPPPSSFALRGKLSSIPLWLLILIEMFPFHLITRVNLARFPVTNRLDSRREEKEKGERIEAREEQRVRV